MQAQRSLYRLQKLLHQLKPNESFASPSVNHASSSEESVSYASNNRVFQNWSQVAECKPQYFHEPSTLPEIISIVHFALKNGNQRIRVIGSGHSPSNIAFCNDHLISLHKYSRIINLDKTKFQVTCQGGTTINQLNVFLEKEGFGLNNLGSISDQTVAGAISTGTHGTGFSHGIFATQVRNLKIVNGLGKVIELSSPLNNNSSNSQTSEASRSQSLKTENLFKAALCSLGVFGIIVEVTIEVEALKHLDSLQYPLKLTEVEGNLNQIIRGAEHSRIWLFPHSDKVSVWQANKSHPDRRSITTKHLKSKIKAKLLDKFVGFYSLESLLYLSTFVPQSVPLINKAYRRILFNGVKHSEDVSYKIFNFDCLFKQYVTEWAIPISKTKEAMKGIRDMIEKNKFKVHFPIEIRFVKADDIWLSPAYGTEETCWIGIIMYRPFGKEVPYKSYFECFESLMESLGGRPHWAKVHKWNKEKCLKSYPKFQEFCELRDLMDPHKLFSNDYTDRVFGS